MVKTSFFNFSEAISQAQVRANPFDLHGTLCGILCVRQDQTTDAWIKEITPEVSAEEQEKLATLLELIQQQLDSPDLDFRLLLPTDQQSLGKRTEALASWSRGFLYGLGIGGLAKETTLDADAQEFLNDVAKIAKAEHHSSDDTHEDEAAYCELVEYLRMGLLLVYESLHPATGAPSPRIPNKP